MQPETPTGETPVVTDPKTNANPTPVVDLSEVEKLRKEREQAEMRANQLANQLKAKEEAEAAAKAKQLEEQNQFKDLYEQEKAKRLEAEAETERKEHEAAVKAEEDKVFAAFPDQVKVLADKLGITLADADDSTVEAFKAKLDEIKGSIAQPKVAPNNPGNRAPAPELSQDDFRATLSDPAKFAEYAQKNLKTVAPMMRQAD